VGCAQPTVIAASFDDGKADRPAEVLVELDDWKAHVDEPSDLAYRDGILYLVSDAHAKIYSNELASGERDDFSIDHAHDLEALAVIGDEWLVADESNAKVWRVDAKGNRHDAIQIDEAEDANSGIEGIAIDPAGRLLVAKEKDPARLIELDEAGTLSDTKVHWAKDLSALTYHDGHYYALSDEDHTLFRLAASLEPEAAWVLPIENPEGLAFAGSTLFICSDAEERVYSYRME
jgi:uncharacterized protein YjiK